MGQSVILLPPGADLSEIEQLRYRIYCTEQRKPMPAADHASGRLPDALDAQARHFVVRRSGLILACGRINVVGTQSAESVLAGLSGLGEVGVHRLAFISKVMVDARHRRVSPIAALLLAGLVDWAIGDGLEVGFCHCSESLVGLYEHAGLVRLPGRSWIDPAAGRQFPMVMLTDADMSRALTRQHLPSRGAPHDRLEVVGRRAASVRRLLGLPPPAGSIGLAVVAGEGASGAPAGARPPETISAALHRRTAPVHLWSGRGSIQTWDAPTLRQRAAAWACALGSQGVAPGDVVATSSPSSLELLAAVFGAWSCEAAVLVLPELAGEQAAKVQRVSDALQRLRPKLLLHDAPTSALGLDTELRHVRLAAECAPSAGPDTTGALTDQDRPDGVALFQLTSGSTGRARAVPITHAMLAANCQAVADRLGVRCDDHMLSWLPLTHDMGFSGAFGGALVCNIPLTLLPTEVFAGSPLALLQAMTDQRATLSPNPPSAYALLARLGRRAQREGIDLSSWRFAWAGAEPVFAHALRAFERAMQPLGLKPAVLQPAYGMAEAVVAVSFAPAGRPWRSLRVQAAALREQGVVLTVGEDHGDPAGDVIELVANGTPLEGVHLQVRDDAGRSLAPGRLGTLWVRGASVASHYVGGEEPQRFVEGWYDTGDQGFLWDGEVYVTGRVKDVIARGGVKVGAHEIEDAAEAALDMRPGRVAAFAHLDHAGGRETVVLVIARRFGAEEPASQRRVADAVLRRCGVAVDMCVFTAAGPLPRTTSGKLQRGLVRERWLGGCYADAQSPGDVAASAPSLPQTLSTTFNDAS